MKQQERSGHSFSESVSEQMHPGPIKATSRKGLAENKRIVARAGILKEKIQHIEKSIKEKFGYPLSHPELLAISQFVAQELSEAIDRDAIRRRVALLSWCAERIETFMTVLDGVTGERDTEPFQDMTSLNDIFDLSHSDDDPSL